MKNKNQYYKCEICGRESFKKIRLGGYILCSKHMHQFHNLGYFKDNNPRTIKDLNDYIIKENIVIFNLYNVNCEKNGEFLVDLEDIQKVKYHKWRLSSFGHVITGEPAKKQVKDLSWIILDIKKEDIENGIVVDHINGNPQDNRKCNLRKCFQSENVLNKSHMTTNTSGFVGVSYKKDKNTYDPEIRCGYVRCHLGNQKNFKHAVYARYVAEDIVFKDFVNEKEHLKKEEFTKNIPLEIKKDIYNKVVNKLIGKNLFRQ